MCGRFYVDDNPFSRKLMKQLSLDTTLTPRRNIAPGAHAQFVIEQEDGRRLQDGLWSMLIEPKPTAPGYRPNPAFSTFNARADSLLSKPLWKGRYARHRAIVPASGFHEWQGKQCFAIEEEGQAIALAGLYEAWEFNGETVWAFATITLPPHPRFSHIHAKSIPLMLQAKDFDAWLDPASTDGRVFQDLMHSHIPVPLIATPVKSPATLEPVGPAEHIPAD